MRRLEVRLYSRLSVRATQHAARTRSGVLVVAQDHLAVTHRRFVADRTLQEARRVAKEKLVLLTWVGFVEDFWLLDYLPQINEIDEPFFPSIEQLERQLNAVRVVPLPIPHDCTNGFLCKSKIFIRKSSLFQFFSNI